MIDDSQFLTAQHELYGREQTRIEKLKAINGCSID